MVWIHAVAEYAAGTYGDNLMNPVGPGKISLLGRYMRLREGDRVLDVGAGQCGPALMLAEQFGCRVTAVEPYGEFIAEARRLVTEAGLADRFEFVQKPGADLELEAGSYDAAMCLGATWAWGGLGGTLDALIPAVRQGGHVAAGEPYKAREDDPPAAGGMHDLTLPGIVGAFEDRGLAMAGIIRSSADDWDQYQSVRNLGFLDWLEAHPGHEDAAQVQEWRRSHALGLAHPHIGWAIALGRRTPGVALS